jgi:formin-binding protein 1
VLEHDDGSGWVKVLDHEGEDGLVPASYLQYAETPTNIEGEVSQRSSITCTNDIESVRALYDYAPRTSDELPLQIGEIIQLTEGPNGGKSYADGWWEGKK